MKLSTRRIRFSASQVGVFALVLCALIYPCSCPAGDPADTIGGSLPGEYPARKAGEIKRGPASDGGGVDELISLLRSGRVDTGVLDAALALGQMKVLCAVGPLIDLLTGSPQETVRFVAATALGEIGDTSAASPLIAVLGDDEAAPSLKAAASTALGKIRDDRAIEPLLRTLRDEDPDVRTAVVTALGMIGNHSAVIPLIAALGDENPWVRSHAAMALGEIKEPLAVDPLVLTLTEDRVSDVRWWAAHALGDLRDSRAVEPLARVVMLRDFETREMLDVQGRGSQQVMEHPLAHLLKSAQWGIQLEAVRSLGMMGEAALPELRMIFMGHEDPEFRKEAAKMIMNIRGVSDTLALLEPDKRLGLVREVYEHVISKGEPGTESLLIEVLRDHGKIHMALDFLGSGNRTLAEAGSAWMKGNGFTERMEIPEGGPRWGRTALP